MAMRCSLRFAFVVLFAVCSAPVAGYGESSPPTESGEAEHVAYPGGAYSGTFKQGRPHGTGRLTSLYGEVLEGEWRDGAFERGTVTLPSGLVIEGAFKNGHLDPYEIRNQRSIRERGIFADSFYSLDPSQEHKFRWPNGARVEYNPKVALYFFSQGGRRLYCDGHYRLVWSADWKRNAANNVVYCRGASALKPHVVLLPTGNRIKLLLREENLSVAEPWTPEMILRRVRYIEFPDGSRVDDVEWGDKGGTFSGRYSAKIQGSLPCTGQCVFRFGGDVNFFEWSDKIVQLWQGGGGASYVGLQLLASKGRSWIPLSRVNHAYGVRRQDDGSFIEGVLDVNVFYGRVFMFSTPDQVLVGDLPTKYTATSRPRKRVTLTGPVEYRTKDGIAYGQHDDGGMRTGPFSVYDRSENLTRLEFYDKGKVTETYDIGADLVDCRVDAGPVNEGQTWRVPKPQCVAGVAHGSGYALSSDANYMLHSAEFDHGRIVSAHLMALRLKGEKVYEGMLRDGRLNGALYLTKGSTPNSPRADLLRYSGPFDDKGEPHGDGRCVVNSKPELCSHEHGERIDPIHYARLEQARVQRCQSAAYTAQHLAPQNPNPCSQADFAEFERGNESCFEQDVAPLMEGKSNFGRCQLTDKQVSFECLSRIDSHLGAMERSRASTIESLQEDQCYPAAETEQMIQMMDEQLAAAQSLRAPAQEVEDRWRGIAREVAENRARVKAAEDREHRQRMQAHERRWIMRLMTGQDEGSRLMRLQQDLVRKTNAIAARSRQLQLEKKLQARPPVQVNTVVNVTSKQVSRAKSPKQWCLDHSGMWVDGTCRPQEFASNQLIVQSPGRGCYDPSGKHCETGQVAVANGSAPTRTGSPRSDASAAAAASGSSPNAVGTVSGLPMKRLSCDGKDIRGRKRGNQACFEVRVGGPVTLAMAKRRLNASYADVTMQYACGQLGGLVASTLTTLADEECAYDSGAGTHCVQLFSYDCVEKGSSRASTGRQE